jgi:Prokaryotic N-terminal methylation motif
MLRPASGPTRRRCRRGFTLIELLLVIAILDGPVHFIKDSVNPLTWWAPATKAGGEVISGDSL